MGAKQVQQWLENQTNTLEEILEVSVIKQELWVYGFMNMIVFKGNVCFYLYISYAEYPVLIESFIIAYGYTHYVPLWSLIKLGFAGFEAVQILFV